MFTRVLPFRSNHPYVMHISSYWFELGYVYFEMPFYSHCTLKEWLVKQNPTPGSEFIF